MASKHFYTLAEVNFMKENDVDLSDEVVEAIQKSFEVKELDFDKAFDRAFEDIVIDPKKEFKRLK